MRFSTLTIAITALMAGAQACQCVNNGADIEKTRDCCERLGGNFVNGKDCQASSISEKLSNFRSCCRERGMTSDCDCPTCKRSTDEGEESE